MFSTPAEKNFNSRGNLVEKTESFRFLEYLGVQVFVMESYQMKRYQKKRMKCVRVAWVLVHHLGLGKNNCSKICFFHTDACPLKRSGSRCPIPTSTWTIGSFLGTLSKLKHQRPNYEDSTSKAYVWKDPVPL